MAKPKQLLAGRRVATPDEESGFQRRLRLVAESRAAGFGTWADLARRLTLELHPRLDRLDLDVLVRTTSSTVLRWRAPGAGPPGPRLLKALVQATSIPHSWWLSGADPDSAGFGDLEFLADTPDLLRDLCYAIERRTLAAWIRENRRGA